MYDLRIERPALREMKALPSQVRSRLDTRILALASQPRPPGAVAMKGSQTGVLRIRIGDYRVIYNVDDSKQVVVVLKIGHRRDIYRRR